MIREFELLAEADASVLSDRRRHAPRGAAGGGDGAAGRNQLNGELVAAKANLRLRVGDVMRIETPGGGGWGGGINSAREET